MTNSLKDAYMEMSIPRWTSFAYSSASFQHILGYRPAEQDLDDFDAVEQYAQKRARVSPEIPLGWKSWQHVGPEDYWSKPRMWVSFHFGVYQFVPLRLLILGCSICLILSTAVLQSYQQYYSKFVKDLPIKGRLYLLAAEDFNLFFRLKQLVEKGFHILVFADGFKGGKRTVDAAFDQVKLHQAQLGVRTGYLRLAKMLRTPVMLILDHTADPRAEGSLLIHAIGGSSEQDLLVSLFYHFEVYLKKNPALWEIWLYLHRYSRPTSSVANWPSARRILPISTEHGGRMLDKYTYREHQLSAKQYEELLQNIFVINI